MSRKVGPEGKKKTKEKKFVEEVSFSHHRPSSSSLLRSPSILFVSFFLSSQLLFSCTQQPRINWQRKTLSQTKRARKSVRHKHEKRVEHQRETKQREERRKQTKTDDEKVTRGLEDGSCRPVDLRSDSNRPDNRAGATGRDSGSTEHLARRRSRRVNRECRSHPSFLPRPQ